MEAAIRCEQLFKRYETGKKVVDAVNGLDLLIPYGECFGLLGPNGAGKTTTVEILEGLREKTAGVVEVLGMQWGAGNDLVLRQQIGITLQETKLEEKLTVLETLRMFRSFYADGMQPERAMNLVSLQEKSDSWVRDLSGGQKQRLAVASALVGDPKLLFLDEPTTGLDPQARRQLWDVVNDLKSGGTTILLTTHYMDEAEKLCERVAIVDKGKVIALGTPRELITQMGGEHIIAFELMPNGSSSIGPEQFESLTSVTSATSEEHGILLTVAEPHVAIPALMDYVKDQGINMASLTTRHANLEDVFVTLTGRHLIVFS
ncbi:MAG: ABC transporter ATP-binding protein [Phycisphaerae bacterium]